MSDNALAAKPTKLEDQIREACRVRHYSLATERSYVRWYKQFVRWAGLKHPATLGGDRVQAWLLKVAGWVPGAEGWGFGAEDRAQGSQYMAQGSGLGAEG
jgi:hypothetical protein